MVAACRRLVFTRYGPLVLFLGLSVLLYGNTLWHGFVFDDTFFTVRGELRDWSHLPRIFLEPSMPQLQGYTHYRPLTFVTFALNFLLFGESPVSFHAVNILLNGITCWLLFMVASKLFGNRVLGLLIALFFTFLPIHTEAVAFVKSRDDMLVATFGLMAWWAWLRSGEGESRHLFAWLSGIATLAACFSKESAIFLPAVFVLVSLCRPGGLHPRLKLTRMIPQAIAVALFFLLRFVAVGPAVAPLVENLYYAQNPLGYVGPGYVLWTAFELLFIAVAQSFVPWNLSAVYGYQHVPIVDSLWGSWMVPSGLLTLLLLAVLIFARRTRATPIGVGALTFAVLYVPFSKFLMVKGVDFFAEHWLYAPSIGLSMIGGYGLWLFRGRPAVQWIAALMVFATYASMIVPRNRVWHDEATLGESMVHDAPDAAHAYAFLAKIRMDQDRVEEAESLVLQGLYITDQHAPLHQIAALVAMRNGDLPTAEKAIARAEELYPELVTDLLRALLLIKSQRYEESLALLRASPWYREDDFKIRLLLAVNLWKLGRHEEAETYFDWDAYTATHMMREEKIRMIEAY